MMTIIVIKAGMFTEDALYEKSLYKHQPLSLKSSRMARIGHVRGNGWTVEEKRERNHAVELTSF